MGSIHSKTFKARQIILNEVARVERSDEDLSLVEFAKRVGMSYYRCYSQLKMLELQGKIKKRFPYEISR